MATYISLVRLTDLGIHNVKDTAKRADSAKKVAKQYGVKMTQIYWTLGQYDLVIVLEAKDDKAMAAYGLAVGSLGFVRMETLRAFDRAEIGEIVKALG